MGRDVYTVTKQTPIISAGGFQDNIYSINENMRNMRIDSIYFDWSAAQQVAPFNKYSVTYPAPDLKIYLEVGTPLVQPKRFNKNLIQVSGLATDFGFPSTFIIWTAGQYYYDSFFVNETLGLRVYLQCSAGSPNSYIVQYTLVLQTEKDIIY